MFRGVDLDSSNDKSVNTSTNTISSREQSTIEYELNDYANESQVEKPNASHFDLLSVLGEGSFGNFRPLAIFNSFAFR
jgi:hypothetical protein